MTGWMFGGFGGKVVSYYVGLLADSLPNVLTVCIAAEAAEHPHRADHGIDDQREQGLVDPCRDGSGPGPRSCSDDCLRQTRQRSVELSKHPVNLAFRANNDK